MKLEDIALQNLNEDKSLTQLQNQTSGAFPSRNASSGEVRLKRKVFTKPGMSSLLIKAIIQGSEQDYEASIQFKNVTFLTPNDSQAIRVGNLYIAPIKLTKDSVQVNCQCKDFRWSFAWYNSSDDSLLGNPPAPYTSKTNRSPRNPRRTSGLCKHLICLRKNLEAEMLFSN